MTGVKRERVSPDGHLGSGGRCVEDAMGDGRGLRTDGVSLWYPRVAPKSRAAWPCFVGGYRSL